MSTPSNGKAWWKSLELTIHAHFARQTGEPIEYATLEAPRDDFASAARRFFDDGGAGANVTLPFKVDALRFAAHASERAAVRVARRRKPA